MGKQRRKCTNEFKLEAVRMLEGGGRSPRGECTALGVPPSKSGSGGKRLRSRATSLNRFAETARLSESRRSRAQRRK